MLPKNVCASLLLGASITKNSKIQTSLCMACHIVHTFKTADLAYFKPREFALLGGFYGT